MQIKNTLSIAMNSSCVKCGSATSMKLNRVKNGSGFKVRATLGGDKLFIIICFVHDEDISDKAEATNVLHKMF